MTQLTPLTGETYRQVGKPTFGGGISLSATTTSTATTLSAAGALCGDLGIYNAGPDLVFMRWGIGAQTAVTTDQFIPAGAIMSFAKFNADTVAVIANTSTATVYVMPMEGE